MTVIAQDDHLTAGAWAACDPTSTFYSDSINLDLASLSLFIRITYDCIHDDSYTEAGSLGHLCN